MSVPDYVFDPTDCTVKLYVEPELFAEWHELRLRWLSTHSAPLYQYKGSNLYHMIRSVGGSVQLANQLAEAFSVSSHSQPYAVIDFSDDVIRSPHGAYYTRDKTGAILNMIPCRGLKVRCRD